MGAVSATIKFQFEAVTWIQDLREERQSLGSNSDSLPRWKIEIDD